MTKVELFEAIRRDHHVRGLSIRQIAKQRGVHRRLVRQALSDAVPPARKVAERSSPVLDAQIRAQIDQWLVGDAKAPRKQRHTARRVFVRLRQETAFAGAESTVRRYVCARRRELGVGKEVFVPLVHVPGAEAEVDWYEATVAFPDGEQVVQVFSMRACHSGREFHMAFPRQTQQAFLEAHVAAFAWFGGVFETVRYDNLKAAVVRVLRGRKRVESDRFVAMRSHYLFEAQFCRPGISGAHEKGGVEGGVGRFRRNHLVPVPSVADFDALNRLLKDGCAQDEQRTRQGHRLSVGEQWQHEQAQLRPLPATSLCTAEVSTASVSAKALVTVRTNRYSVPVALAHRTVEVRVHARRVELVAEGKVVAVHERLQTRHGLRVELDHYLALLWRKPGALHQSAALQQARERGSWPASYDTLHSALRQRYDWAEAARQLLAVVMLHRQAPQELVHRAVQAALEHGSYDAGAVAVTLRQLQQPEQRGEPLADLGALHRFDRPALPMTGYDLLLGRKPGEWVH